MRHFALLFDDLPGKMSDDDRRAYDSLAAAQCDVTNAIFAWARERFAGTRFLFCPTPYCDRMDRAQLGGAGYLDEVGRLLSAEIDVLWTGPEIVSPEIPVESIDRLSRRIRRPPLIWDNLFANDYDFSRALLRPVLRSVARIVPSRSRHPHQSEQRISRSTSFRSAPSRRSSAATASGNRARLS